MLRRIEVRTVRGESIAVAPEEAEATEPGMTSKALCEWTAKAGARIPCIVPESS